MATTGTPVEASSRRSRSIRGTIPWRPSGGVSFDSRIEKGGDAVLPKGLYRVPVCVVTIPGAPHRPSRYVRLSRAGNTHLFTDSRREPNDPPTVRKRCSARQGTMTTGGGALQSGGGQAGASRNGRGPCRT